MNINDTQANSFELACVVFIYIAKHHQIIGIRVFPAIHFHIMVDKRLGIRVKTKYKAIPE
ncbi:MAG: hypothetical protein CMJ19_01330 [Phycisphaeraceae bacterium]|nr:hypothetical protein [Phycisphaeraceae bacterium]